MPKAGFVCDVCQEVFRSNGGLGSHTRHKHGDLTRTPTQAPARAPTQAPSTNPELVLHLDDDHLPPPPEDLSEVSAFASRVKPVALANLQSQQRTSRFGPYQNASQWKFAKVARKLQLRRFQVAGLLGLFEDEDFSPKDLEGLKAIDLERIQGNLKDREPFVQAELHIDGIRYQVSHRSVVNIALEMFSSPLFAGSTALSFALQVDEDGRRVYSEFHTGEWFQEAQKLVGETLVPVAVILHADEKRVAVKNGVKVYPVTISLGNHTFDIRQKKFAKRVVAYIPLAQGKRREDRRHQLKLHQGCMRLLLSSIKKRFGTWIEAKDPSGIDRRVAVLLATICCDWEEGAKMALVLKMPSPLICHTCLCPTCSFSDFIKSTESLIRSSSSCLAAWRGQGLTRRARKSAFLRFCKDNSLVPLWNTFWSLPGFDIFSCMGPDCLHVLDLGLFEWQVKFVFAEIDEIYQEKAEKVKDEINTRFALLPPFPGLIHFPNGITKVALDKKGKFQGREYRSMMKQFVVVLIGLTLDESILAILAFLKMYALAKKPSHTSVSLTDLNSAVSEFMVAMQTFVDYSPSKLNFPKFHVPAHFAYFIRKFGHLRNLDTETFEQFLHFAAQVPFDSSSKKAKSMGKEMAAFIQRQDNASFIEETQVPSSLSDLSDHSDLSDLSDHSNPSDHSGLSESESDQEWSSCSSGSSDSDTDEEETNKPRFLGKGKNLDRSAIQALLNTQGSLPVDRVTDRLMQGKKAVRTFTTARLSNGQRATAGHYHGRDVFASVDYRDRGGMTYGQLVVLARAGEDQDLCVVRPYAPETRDVHDQVRLAGLTPLKMLNSLKVVPLSDIDNIVHIVPNFSSRLTNSFILNHFVS